MIEINKHCFSQNMPRRRVSVAVVPKFNSLNIPGQSPTASPIPSMPSLVSKPHILKILLSVILRRQSVCAIQLFHTQSQLFH